MTWVKTDKKVYPKDWDIGSVYCRQAGERPFVLLHVDGSHVHGCYDTMNPISGQRTFTSQQSYLWLCEKDTFKYNKEEENTMTKENKLYQVKGSETYGTYLATNSEGKYVLEIKGSNEVKAFDKKDLEEVLPYTVGIRFQSGQPHHFKSTKGALEVGDFVVRTDRDYWGSFGIVTEVDTKDPKATKFFEGYKLNVDKIPEG